MVARRAEQASTNLFGILSEADDSLVIRVMVIRLVIYQDDRTGRFGWVTIPERSTHRSAHLRGAGSGFR